MSKKGNPEDYNDDDWHIDPGDDGLINTGAEMPPFLDRVDPDTYDEEEGWGFENEVEFLDGLEAYFSLAEAHNYHRNFAAERLDLYNTNTGTGVQDYRLRGTLYMSPEEALQAILDANIFGIALVVRVEGGWSIAVLSNSI